MKVKRSDKIGSNLVILVLVLILAATALVVVAGMGKRTSTQGRAVPLCSVADFGCGPVLCGSQNCKASEYCSYNSCATPKYKCIADNACLNCTYQYKDVKKADCGIRCGARTCKKTEACIQRTKYCGSHPRKLEKYCEARAICTQ